MADFVEVVVNTEVAGAGHDVLFAEGRAEKVRIHAIDVEGHGGVGLSIDKVDFGFIMEEIVELGGVGEKVLVVFFGAMIEPVNGGVEGDNFCPSLKAGFENGVSVVFILSGKEVMIGKNIVDHAATDKREFELRDEVAADDHDAE